MNCVSLAILAAAVLHVLEEHAWPGGFPAFMKRMAPRVAPAVTTTHAVVVNGAFLLLGPVYAAVPLLWLGLAFLIRRYRSAASLLMLLMLATACAGLSSEPPALPCASPKAVQTAPQAPLGQEQGSTLPVLLDFPEDPATAELTARLDNYLRATSPAFSGSALVARQGKILLNRGYGLADIENQVPNTPLTRFRIGSITKSFTAMAIVLLQERGLLTVDDPLCDYVEGCPAAWQPITLHQLLTHTSGIPSYTEFPELRQQATTFIATAEMIALFEGKPLDFEPGEQFRYSNSGYYLLGCVVEQVAGVSYEQFVHDNLLLPLSMGDSGYDHPETILARRASGYTRRGDRLENAPYRDMSLPFAAGALYSTVEDLYRWDQALYGGELVSPSAVKVIFAPLVPTATGTTGFGYGYGWFVSEAPAGRYAKHEGEIAGFGALLLRDTQERLTVILLSNIERTEVGLMGQDLLDLANR